MEMKNDEDTFYMHGSALFADYVQPVNTKIQLH